MRIQAVILSIIILISVFLSNGAAEGWKIPSADFLRDDAVAVGAGIMEGVSMAVKKASNIFRSAEEKITSGVSKANSGIASAHNEIITKIAEYSLRQKSGGEHILDGEIAVESLSGAGWDTPAFGISNYCGSIDASGLGGKAEMARFFNYNITVFEKNINKRWPIASITKLMTAVVALEKINPHQKITMSEKDVSWGGAIGDFQAGEVFYASDLIKAMLVASSNDAASALASKVGEEEFVNAMQRKANELGMNSTTYLEPTGLSFVNQSTISDLAKLISYIYKNHEEILATTRQSNADILELKSGRRRILPNVDAFAGQPDFIGGKTGFIDESGRNLVALFNVKGQIALFAVLGSSDAFEEIKKMKEFVVDCNPARYGRKSSQVGT